MPDHPLTPDAVEVLHCLSDGEPNILGDDVTDGNTSRHMVAHVELMGAGYIVICDDPIGFRITPAGREWLKDHGHE